MVWRKAFCFRFCAGSDGRAKRIVKCRHASLHVGVLLAAVLGAGVDYAAAVAAGVSVPFALMPPLLPSHPTRLRPRTKLSYYCCCCCRCGCSCYCLLLYWILCTYGRRLKAKFVVPFSYVFYFILSAAKKVREHYTYHSNVLF